MASPLAAQRITSPYDFIDTKQSVSAFAGSLRTRVGSVGLGPKAGSIFGVEAGYRASGPLVLELAVAYAPLKRDVRDTVFVAAADSTFRVLGPATQNIVIALAALRFDITGARTWHNLQPFALIGGGLAIGSSSNDGPEVPQDLRFSFGTSFAAQLGGGIEWYATRRVGLRVEGRGLLWKLKTPAPFQNADPTLPRSEWTQNAAITAGLSVHF